MKIDKDLYRQAYEYYRRWNEAELRERIQNAGMQTSQEKLLIYLELWDFFSKMGAKVSSYQRSQKLAALNLYYDRLQKMEAWRRAHAARS
jgi:hypothetical protein